MTDLKGTIIVNKISHIYKGKHHIISVDINITDFLIFNNKIYILRPLVVLGKKERRKWASWDIGDELMVKENLDT